MSCGHSNDAFRSTILRPIERPHTHQHSTLTLVDAYLSLLFALSRVPGSEEQIVCSFPLYYRNLTGVRILNLQERSMPIMNVSTHTTAASRGVMDARSKKCRSGPVERPRGSRPSAQHLDIGRCLSLFVTRAFTCLGRKNRSCAASLSTTEV